jgi:hypothetical protein
MRRKDKSRQQAHLNSLLGGMLTASALAEVSLDQLDEIVALWANNVHEALGGASRTWAVNVITAHVMLLRDPDNDQCFHALADKIEQLNERRQRENDNYRNN